MNSVSAFIAQIFKTYFNRLLAMLFIVGTTVVVSRTLGPEGRGWVATATTLAGVGTILGSLGLPQINAYYGAKEPLQRPALLGNSLLVTALVTLLLGGLFWLGRTLAPQFFLLPGAFLFWTILYAGLQLLFTLLQQLMVGMDLVRQYNITELAQRGLALALVATLCWCGQTEPVSYFALTALAFVPVIIWGTRLCLRHTATRPRLSWPLLRRTAAYSTRLYLIALCFNVFMGLDILLTQTYLGVDNAGLYSIAASMRQMLLVFTLVVQTLLLPRLVKLDSYDLRQKAAWRFAGFTLAGTLVISGITWLVADPVVKLLFGESFLPATTALTWMLPGYIVYSCAGVLAVLLQAEGQPWYSVLPMVLALAGEGLAGVMCIAPQGLAGGAMAYSAGCFVYLVAQVAAMGWDKRRRLHPRYDFQSQ